MAFASKLKYRMLQINLIGFHGMHFSIVIVELKAGSLAKGGGYLLFAAVSDCKRLCLC